MMHAQSKQYIMLDNYAGVAQVVEQWTENPCVAGSIPAQATIKKLKVESLTFYFFCL